MRKFTLALGAAGAALTLAAGALAQDRAAPAPPAFMPATVKPVKPGVFMVIGNGGNTTVRVGENALIVVDTKNPGQEIFDDLMAKIRSISPKPIKYVFITHVHNDHSGNTGRMEAAGATVIAQEGEKTLLATYPPGPDAQHSAAPNITFGSSYTVKIPGATATAYHFAPAHTGGDALIFFPDVKVLATGDEVAQNTNFDYPDGGSALGAQKSLAAADKLDFDTVIPGHGANPLTRAQFESYRHDLDTLIDRARALVKAGTPKDQLMAKLKTDDLGFAINVAQWSQPARLDAFYAELSK